MSKYSIAMLVLAALALLMSVHDVASITLMATLGLAFPIFFAATILLYGLCAGPLVMSWHEGAVDRAVGASVTAVLVAVVALVPSYLGRRTADAEAKTRLTADYVASEPVRPSTIEILDGDDWSSDGSCGIECHQLLKSGQAQWIRAVKIKSGGRSASPTSTFLRTLRGKACAVPGAAPDDNKVCVVVATDPGDAAELVVDVSRRPTPVQAVRQWRFSAVVSERVVVAQRRQAGQLTETMRQTEVTVEAVGRPTLIAPVGVGMHTDGTDFLRERYKVNPLTLAGVLTRLGYSLDKPADTPPTMKSIRAKMDAPIDDAMTREMISVLDLPGDKPFDRDQMAPISTWIQHAHRVRVWTPDLLALLRRFVRDRRVRTPTFFVGLFVKPEVAKALLPDILDMIEIDGIGRDYTPAREAAYRFETIDASLLAPHAARIVALLDKSPDVRAILLPAIGRIGIDPLPYLTPILADRTSPSPYSTDPRAIGACRADPQWASELVGPLRAAYAEVPGVKYADVAYRGQLLKALANLGDHEFVEHELATSQSDASRLRRQIASDSARKDRANWLCRW